MKAETDTKAVPWKWCSEVKYKVALLKAQVSLQLGNVSSSDNGVSLSIMYSGSSFFAVRECFQFR